MPARVLELGYSTGTRDEAVRVVDAVIRSYDRFLKDNYQKNSNEVIALIVKARDELSTELKKLEQEYLEFRQKSPAHGGNGEGQTFVARRLDQWDQAINQATVPRAPAQVAAGAGTRARRRGGRGRRGHERPEPVERAGGRV